MFYGKWMDAPLTHAEYDTPFGALHVFADAQGRVRASGFPDALSIAAHLPSALLEAGWSDSSLDHIEQAVSAWLAGDADALARVPVYQEGSAFRLRVWEAIRRVPGGTTMSYRDLAAAAGNPSAIRAAASACGLNATAPFVPCHRIVSSGAKVGQYGFGGPAIKAAMLTLEAGGTRSQIDQVLRTASALTAVPAGT